MKGRYLFTYMFLLNGASGIGSINMTMKQDQPITPEVIQNAVEYVRKNSNWDASVKIVPLSWCRYESECTRAQCYTCPHFKTTEDKQTGTTRCVCELYQKYLNVVDIMTVKPELMRGCSDISEMNAAPDVDEYDLSNLPAYIDNRDFEHAIDTILHPDNVRKFSSSVVLTQIDNIYGKCSAISAVNASRFFAAILYGVDKECDLCATRWISTLKKVKAAVYDFLIPPDVSDDSEGYDADVPDFLMIRHKLRLSKISYKAFCVAASMAFLYFDNDDLRANLNLEDDFWDVLPKSTVQLGGDF